MQALQHDADIFTAKPIQRRRRQRHHILLRHRHLPRRRTQNTRQHMQQRGFAAARRPQHQPLRALLGLPSVDTQHVFSVIGMHKLVNAEHGFDFP